MAQTVYHYRDVLWSAALEPPYPAYKGDAPYIFICYSHQDAAVVFPELERLRELGVNVYYDEGVTPGHEWTQELADAIDGSARFLYFVSPASVASRQCRNEVQYALGQEKSVVSVHLEPTELPGSLRLSLGSVQAILKYELSAQIYERKLSSTCAPGLQSPIAETLRMPLARAYRGAAERAPAPTQRRAPVLIPIGLVVVALIGGGWWYSQTTPFFWGEHDDVPPAIAVLPFTNIGETAGYFGDGVAEEVLNRMIRLHDVRVISRQSSFAFKGSPLDVREIGRALGADYVLQGTLQRGGTVVRVSVRLTDAADGTEIWGQSYDREVTDILRLQDEIAQAAIAEFIPNITFTERTRGQVDPAAYELLLRARAALSANAPKLATSFLQSAIAIDRDFAEAHGLLVVALSSLSDYGEVDDDEIQSALNQAMELDPNNPSVLGVQVGLRLRRDFDVQTAISTIESLIGRFPSYVSFYRQYWELLSIALKIDQLPVVMERIQALDPQSSRYMEFATYFILGDFDRVRRAAQQMPMDQVGEYCWSGRRAWLLIADLATGQFDAAERHLEQLEQNTPSTPATEHCLLTYKAWLAAELGQREALRAFTLSYPRILMSNLVYYWLPLDVIGSGDTSRTLDEIENLTSPSAFVWVVRLPLRDRWISRYGSPVFKEAFESLRQEPRYQQALRKYGIDEVTLADVQTNTQAVLN